MRVSKTVFLLPLLAMMGIALAQPVSAETKCTKTTTTVTTFSSPYMVERITEAPILVEPSTYVMTSSPVTVERRCIAQPVVIKEKTAKVLIERPAVVERPIMVERPVVIERNVMMEQPVVIKEKRNLLRFSLF